MRKKIYKFNNILQSIRQKKAKITEENKQFDEKRREEIDYMTLFCINKT